jgi:hypothetical protein
MKKPSTQPRFVVKAYRAIRTIYRYDPLLPNIG